MTANVEGHCAIFDYDFSTIVYAEGVEGSGGAAAVEEITVAGRNYADVRAKGRQPKKYKVKARSLDRDEIETFLRTCNTLPDEAEFFPFDSERMGYIASAFAALQPVQRAANGYNFYEAVAEITCREAWLYGPDQGILFGWYRSLPSVSSSISNDGHERSPISYMQCSGDYAGGYVEDLSVRITRGGGERDRELALCEKMMRRDILELGWRGEVRHSYEYNCDRLVSELSTDLHGLVSGGLWTGENLLLVGGNYVMIPFYGPLPVAGSAGAASLELDIAAIGNSARFTSYNFPARYICHINYFGEISDVSSVDDQEFYVRSGLVAGTNYISLESVSFPGYYLVWQVADSRVVLAEPVVGDITFAQRATFELKSGLADAGAVSFAGIGDYAQYYIRHYAFHLYLHLNTGGGFANDATFWIVPDSVVNGAIGTVQLAEEIDLSDIADVDHDDLVVGSQTISIPDLQGKGTVIIGIKADADSYILLSRIKGVVNRYIAPSKIPFAEPDEDFYIKVESSAGDQLRFLQTVYNNRYWY